MKTAAMAASAALFVNGGVTLERARGEERAPIPLNVLPQLCATS
jgi:hypothetical protein